MLGACHLEYSGDVQKDTIERRCGFYDANDRKKETVMLSVIVVVLLVLWLLGMATSYTMGGILHLLLVVAIAAALLRIVQGRTPIRG
jgi:formate hydrogenlyase subunit 4